MEKTKDMGIAPYARVLGFKKSSATLLTKIKERASIPLVTKLADAEELLDKAAYDMLRQDIRISQVYNGIEAHRADSSPTNEISTPLVII